MSGKITTIQDVREYSLDVLERLRAGQIDLAEAGVTGKIIEGIISTVKTELLYAEFTGRDAHIDFMGTMNSKEVKDMSSRLKKMAAAVEHQPAKTRTRKA